MKSVIARELNDFGIEGNMIQTNWTTFAVSRRTACFEVIGPVYRLKLLNFEKIELIYLLHVDNNHHFGIIQQKVKDIVDSNIHAGLFC